MDYTRLDVTGQRAAADQRIAALEAEHYAHGLLAGEATADPALDADVAEGHRASASRLEARLDAARAARAALGDPAPPPARADVPTAAAGVEQG